MHIRCIYPVDKIVLIDYSSHCLHKPHLLHILQAVVGSELLICLSSVMAVLNKSTFEPACNYNEGAYVWKNRQG